MKKEFKKPTLGEKDAVGSMDTIAATKKKNRTEATNEDKFVTLDGFVDSNKTNNFPKHIQGRKPLQTGDVVSNLVRRCDNYIKNTNTPSSRSVEDKGPISLSFSDFSAISMTRPFADVKKYVKGFKNVKGIKIVNNPRTNKSYLVAILDLEKIVSDEEPTPLRQDLSSRIDMNKIDPELLAVQSDDYDYLVVVSEEEIGMALDIRRVLLTMLKPSIVTSTRLADTIALSEVEIKGDRIIYAIKSLIAGSSRYNDSITFKRDELVCANISVSEERFRRICEEKLSSISSSFLGIRTVRTVDIVNSMMIPSKELNYLLGISTQTGVNYAPLIEFDERSYQKQSVVENQFLQSMALRSGYKIYDKESVYRDFKEILDKDMVYMSRAGVNNSMIYLLPNLRKLGAYVFFDGKVDTTYFKSSVTTTMNTISFVFIV